MWLLLGMRPLQAPWQGGKQPRKPREGAGMSTGTSSSLLIILFQQVPAYSWHRPWRALYVSTRCCQHTMARQQQQQHPTSTNAPPADASCDQLPITKLALLLLLPVADTSAPLLVVWQCKQDPEGCGTTGPNLSDAACAHTDAACHKTTTFDNNNR